ncbi:LLM class flavin-dependent oxidoreductase [Candidatus Poriferisocius sp.]|uniref:LLM class flavin-dependent oxidoreductase n=1 Tax=Candidatus Poriferisocius sp. TaxID=3101276 RepID=UPI003B0181E9
MKFGVFYEHQLPRPWRDGDEQRLLHEALEQVERADELGFDYAWEVEHHFLEEYSHSSAPEVFLAAASQRTERIRLGHGIVQMPPAYNHPARVAERIATLDLISNGRVEFGTGESSAAVELGGFNIAHADKRPAWAEATEQCCNMMVMDPYPGFEGQYFSMPCRNVVPKPAQKPHPPLWVACSNRETIKLAARLGMGALTFAFVDPDEAAHWVDDYYRILSTECVPIGHTVNANIAMVVGLSVHPDQQEAERRGLEGFRFFGHGLLHYYVSGRHQPGRTSVWDSFRAANHSFEGLGETLGIGTPDQVTNQLRGYAEAGVDQVMFIQQSGRNRHEHICQSLELFAHEVMPVLKEGEADREAAKATRLAPHIQAALARRIPLEPLPDEHIPVVDPLGTS